MEKVENPYRTARVPKVSIDASGHAGSRLSDHACAMRAARSMAGDAIRIRRRMRVSCRRTMQISRPMRGEMSSEQFSLALG